MLCSNKIELHKNGMLDLTWNTLSPSPLYVISELLQCFLNYLLYLPFVSFACLTPKDWDHSARCCSSPKESRVPPLQHSAVIPFEVCNIMQKLQSDSKHAAQPLLQGGYWQARFFKRWWIPLLVWFPRDWKRSAFLFHYFDFHGWLS